MSGRRIVVAFVAAGLLIIILHDIQEAGFAADRLKRIQELEAREVHLYEQLAQKDAQRESQRRIYIDRMRRSETQLRGQSGASSTILAVPPISRD